jgi:hypothetical protein
MPGETTLVGTVVAQAPDSPFPASPNDGLYLMTEEGNLLRLVTAHIAAQMPIDMLHRQSRSSFEAMLGERVTVRGYLSKSTLYGAILVE